MSRPPTSTQSPRQLASAPPVQPAHQRSSRLTAAEVFVGVGGAALGIARAGFQLEFALDADARALETFRRNQANNPELFGSCEVFCGDARTFDFSSVGKSFDLLVGGPPCQPFSLAGKHQAFRDERDVFPLMGTALDALRPRAFLVENVPGLLRPGFHGYFEYIRLLLSFPSLTRSPGESLFDHLSRLRQRMDSAASDGREYNVQHRLLNAADFGLPQVRRRLFIIGFRRDVACEWTFPQATHTKERLLHDQLVSEEYWRRHGRRPAIAHEGGLRHLQRLQQSLFPPIGRPWRTVRDGLDGLPDPRFKGAVSSGPPNHEFVGGARPYSGHTGSLLDWPAKTIKGGVHGVPGGENMIRLDDGGVRYMTIREAARLQGFPDTYEFVSGRSQAMKHIGNGVPVNLSEVLGRALLKSLGDEAGIARY